MADTDFKTILTLLQSANGLIANEIMFHLKNPNVQKLLKKIEEAIIEKYGSRVFQLPKEVRIRITSNVIVGALIDYFGAEDLPPEETDL